MNGTGAQPTPTTASSASPSGSGTPPPGIPSVLKPGPGGNVVYYRVD